MRERFDPRVVTPAALELVRQCQARELCLLGGGAALAGAFLAHRRSRDLDLFCQDARGVRELARALPDAGQAAGLRIEIVRDAATHVRARATAADTTVEVDLVYEPTPEVDGSPTVVEGVHLRSLVDLRASKLTCILSRSEPRDLVDLLFLDRAGFPPEDDLGAAVTKDGGMDPGVLSWLLAQFPTRPLPEMLEPLSETTLAEFRDTLVVRMRARAVPGLR